MCNRAGADLLRARMQPGASPSSWVAGRVSSSLPLGNLEEPGYFARFHGFVMGHKYGLLTFL
jgi:hypothetical protein